MDEFDRSTEGREPLFEGVAGGVEADGAYFARHPDRLWGSKPTSLAMQPDDALTTILTTTLTTVAHPATPTTQCPAR